MWHAYGLIGDVPQSRVNQKDQKAKRVEPDTMSKIQDSILRAETNSDPSKLCGPCVGKMAKIKRQQIENAEQVR